MANSTELSIVIRAKNEAEATLKTIDAQFKSLGMTISNLNAQAMGAGSALNSIGTRDDVWITFRSEADSSSESLKRFSEGIQSMGDYTNSADSNLLMLSDSFNTYSRAAADSYQPTKTFSELGGAVVTSTEAAQGAVSSLSGELVSYNEGIAATKETHSKLITVLEATSAAISVAAGAMVIHEKASSSWFGAILRGISSFAALALAVHLANSASDGWIKTLANLTIEFVAVSAAIGTLNTLTGGLIFNLATKAAGMLGIALTSVAEGFVLVGSRGLAASLAVGAMNLVLDAGAWASKNYALALGLIAVTVASVMAGILLITKAIENMTAAAKYQTEMAAIENLAMSYGQSAKKIAEALQDASGGILSFHESMLLVKETLDKDIKPDAFIDAMKTARIESKLTGETIEAVFTRMASGIRGGTSTVKDGIPVVVDLDKAYKHYAETLGVTVDALSAKDKKEAALIANQIAHAKIIKSLGQEYMSDEQILRSFGTMMKDVWDSVWESTSRVLVLFLRVGAVLNDLASSTLGFIASKFFNLIGATKLSEVANKIYVNSLDDLRQAFSGLVHWFGLSNGEMDKAKLKSEATAKATKTLANETAAAAKAAEEAGKALDNAFSILGVVQAEKEIKKYEDAYKTLESSGKATSEELSQAWDNMKEKIAKLRGEVDPLAEAYKLFGQDSVKSTTDKIEKLEAALETVKESGETNIVVISKMGKVIKDLRDSIDPVAEAFKSFGVESISSAADRLEKLESAYQTVKASGEASAITIMNAWIKLNDEQEKSNNFAKAWEGFISSRVLPAVNAYVSAMHAASAEQVSASRTDFDVKLKQIADEAKNAGKSIEIINALMTNKFAESSKISEAQAKSIGDIRKASNALADDLEREGNAQIVKYQQIISKLKEVGTTERQIAEYRVAAAKDEKSRMEARLAVENAGLAALIKIRDESLDKYKSNKEAIKVLDSEAVDIKKKSADTEQALREKGLSEEQKTASRLKEIGMDLWMTESLIGDKKRQALNVLRDNAAQVAISAQKNSNEEVIGKRMEFEASQKLLEVNRVEAEAQKAEAEANKKNNQQANIDIAKKLELIPALNTALKALDKTIEDSNLAIKISLLDEALEPARKLKAELKDYFKDDIIQKIRLEVDEGGELGKAFKSLKSSGRGGDGGLTAEELSALNAALAHQNGTDGPDGGDMPSYAEGISYVPRDQVARIHQGEAVLTREENARYRSGKSGNVTFGDINIHPPKGVEITSAVALEIRKKLEQLGRRVR